MSECVTGKRMYSTKELAEDALVDAWSRHAFSQGQGPVAVYRCEDCGEFHLTRSGEMNPRLAKEISDGKIRLQLEANHWLSRIRKK